MQVWLFEPYYTGSHRAWARGYARHSCHCVTIFAMDGRFWKWRMQGGALELAAQANARLDAGEHPDGLLVSDMTNLPALLALTPRLVGVPVLFYFHENQLTYPLPSGERRDLTYGMINLLSALTADRVRFNSRYHLEIWFDELPRLLKHFPDYNHLEVVQRLRERSGVLPVGCDLKALEAWKVEDGDRKMEGGKGRGGIGNKTGLEVEGEDQPPLVLWNQRWEYDKNPGEFFQALYRLHDEGVPFRLALAGENFRMVPDEFEEARRQLREHIVHYGYAETRAAYARLLWEADVVVSTAIHEFFGISIVEAMYCHTFPLLPRRLSYPELIPTDLHAACLYDDFHDLLCRLRQALTNPESYRPLLPRLRAATACFDWQRLAPIYDDLLASITPRQSPLPPAAPPAARA